MKTRKFIKFLFLITCLFLFSFNAFAADENLGLVVDGSKLTDLDDAEGIALPRLRGAYFSNGTGKISITGTRKVYVSGSTTAYQNCDSVKVTIYLQRYINNRWETIATVGPKYAYNNYYVSVSNTYSVTGGYYYRVMGSHRVSEGSTVETSASYTNGIWIS